MDWWDLSLKFSTEVLVVGLGLLVAGLNVFFFAGNPTYTDGSHAAKFLAYHNSLNPKLYYKNTATKTIVASSGFINQAQADDYIGADITGDSAPADPSAAPDNSQILGQANPDSLSALIAKQIKVYTVQNGDTLKSLSSRFGVSQNSIIWSNNLPSSTIKPGWQLVIPPIDGVVVKATDNDTLPDLAHKYNPQRYNSNKTTREAAADQLLQSIISYNGLEGAEDISGGDVLIIPGGMVASPPAAPKPRSSGSGTIIGGGSGLFQLGEHFFPKGYCTYYVASKMTINFGGNAKAWINNAKAAGYTTSNVPVPGAAVVTNDSKRFGHVAYVERVTDDSIIVTEMNFSGFNKVDSREIPLNNRSIRGYIYPLK